MPLRSYTIEATGMDYKEYDLARKFILDRHNNLTATSRVTGISLTTLYRYRANPDSLNPNTGVSRINIHKLAQLQVEKDPAVAWKQDLNKKPKKEHVRENLTGLQFGHLTVTGKSGKVNKRGEELWICQCDCGKQVLEPRSPLISGAVISCGHVRHQHKLGDRFPAHNKTGLRNISIVTRNGKQVYFVHVKYNGKQHSHYAHSIQEALRSRKELREEWWPNYKSKD